MFASWKSNYGLLAAVTMLYQLNYRHLQYIEHYTECKDRFSNIQQYQLCCFNFDCVFRLHIFFGKEKENKFNICFLLASKRFWYCAIQCSL